MDILRPLRNARKTLGAILLASTLAVTGCGGSGGGGGGDDDPANHAPEITTNIIPESYKGEVLNGDFNATDSDGDSLNYSVPSPAGVTVNSSTGQFTYTPTSPGVVNFTFRVEDGKGGSDEQVVPVDVKPTFITSGTLESSLDDDENGSLDPINNFRITLTRQSDSLTYTKDINSTNSWTFPVVREGNYTVTLKDLQGKHLDSQLGTFVVKENFLDDKLKMTGNQWVMIPNKTNFPQYLQEVFAKRVGWTNVEEGPKAEAPLVISYLKNVDGSEVFVDEAAKEAWKIRLKGFYLDYINKDKQDSHPNYGDNPSGFEFINEFPPSVLPTVNGADVWTFDQNLPVNGGNITETDNPANPHKKIAGSIVIKNPSISDAICVSEALSTNRGGVESEKLIGAYNNAPTLPNKNDKAVAVLINGSKARSYDVYLGTAITPKDEAPLTFICNRNYPLLSQTSLPISNLEKRIFPAVSNDGYTPKDEDYSEKYVPTPVPTKQEVEF